MRLAPLYFLIMSLGTLGSALCHWHETNVARAATLALGQHPGMPRAASAGADSARFVVATRGDDGFVPVKGPVDVFDLDVTRTPVLAADHQQLAILGLGQDADSGTQIVWIRNVLTNRIRGFHAGSALFNSKIELVAIHRDHLILRHRGLLQRFDLLGAP